MQAARQFQIEKSSVTSQACRRSGPSNSRTAFKSPQDVVENRNLTSAEKVLLLLDWAYDACELAVAEEEGMAGGVASEVYSVISALNEVTAGFDVEHTGPTKHAAFVAGRRSAPNVRTAGAIAKPAATSSSYRHANSGV